MHVLPIGRGSFAVCGQFLRCGYLRNDVRYIAESGFGIGRNDEGGHKLGGMVCVGAYGPEHYWEAIDASFRSIKKRCILGYRLEWWPRNEKYMPKGYQKAALENIISRRHIWRNKFENGLATDDFFAAISASWWYAIFPADESDKDSRRTRSDVDRRNVRVVTDDIVGVYGYKPKKPASHEAGRSF